ncbi:MAG: hypothetical protein MUE69_08650 [Myxococcota bacterium]|nr:hypothetical protein [Myxococcota bacterium]
MASLLLRDRGWPLLHGIALVVAGAVYIGVARLTGRGPRWPAAITLHLVVATSAVCVVVVAPVLLGWRQAVLLEDGAAFIDVAHEAERWVLAMRIGDGTHVAASVCFFLGLVRTHPADRSMVA